MARTAAEISQAMRAQLRALDRDISAEPLTVERKIIDTVAEAISEAELDQYVNDYQYDLDTKAGDELDRFVGLFGFARQGGKRARGKVTFSRTVEAANAASTSVLIPSGVQVRRPGTTGLTATINFQTLVSVILYPQVDSIEVDIEGVEVGEQGNVPASSITIADGLSAYSITAVSNNSATTGGRNPESDAELRARFRRTIFRNLAGTKDQFLALALASKYSTKAIVLGPQSRYIEQMQVEGDLTMLSGINHSKYAYPFDYYLTDGNAVSEIFYLPSGVDYTFAPNNPGSQTFPITLVKPTVTVVDTVDLPIGKIVYLEHTYCSANSRNDPLANIYNAVDVYVGGSDPVSATETCLFPSVATKFSSTPGDAFFTGKFQRQTSQVAPNVNHRLQELLWQPVSGLPVQIQITTSGGTTYTYTLNTHYWLVEDITAYRGSRRCRNGIEWSTTAITNITAGTQYTVTYTFNRLPMTLNELVDSHKAIGSDALVHEAINRYFQVNLAIMYTPGFSVPAVNDSIQDAITDFFEGVYFGAIIQFSDLEQIVHNVSGVDNVRIATSGDGSPYGVTEWSSDNSTAITTYTGNGTNIFTNDFALQDAHLPILNSVNIKPKSQNTWI